MIFIDRPTVSADVVNKAFRLDLLLAAVMMSEAQALQFTAPKQEGIAFMRHNVVGNLCWSDYTIG